MSLSDVTDSVTKGVTNILELLGGRCNVSACPDAVRALADAKNIRVASGQEMRKPGRSRVPRSPFATLFWFSGLEQRSGR